MKLYRLMIYDWKKGILKKNYCYFILFLFCGILFFDFYQRITIEMNIPWKESSATSMNLFLYVLQGKLPFHPNREDTFQLPVMWLLIFLYASFLTLNYPYKDFWGYELQRMKRGLSRGLWWYSKCLWLLSATLLYFFVLYLSLSFFCVVFGENISTEYEPYLNEYLLQGGLGEITEGQLLVLMFVLPVLTSLGTSYVQLVMGLFWDRVYCYLFSSAFLFASTYYSFPFLTGNFAMVKRSIFFRVNGFAIWQGIIINIGIIVLSIGIGRVRIGKINLVRRPE